MNTKLRHLRLLASALVLAFLLTSFGRGSASPVRAQTGGFSAAALSDGQFVYGPNAYDFDLPAWLAANAPHLLPYASALDGSAAYASVNPRLFLTLMEMRTGLVSDASANPENPFGWDENGFNAQLEAAADVLTSAYYLHLHHYSALDPSERSLPPLPLADGSGLAVAPEVNAGTYAVLAFLAHTETADSLPDALAPFAATWERLFPGNDPLDESNQVYVPGSVMAQDVPPPSLLELPFARGEAWRFNGVHHNLGYAGSDASSIDFTNAWVSWICPGEESDCMDGYAPYDLSPYPIRAAHSGWITTIAGSQWGITAPCQATVYTNYNKTGWATRYYHLENVQATPGAAPAPIAQNAILGYMADTKKEAMCNGGGSTGHHVHFSLMYNGAFVPINGTALSGWVINAQYSGSDLVPYGTGTYLERGGVTRSVYQTVLNDYSPLTPTPLSPDNGALLSRTTPVAVSWSTPPSAAAYFVELLQNGTPIANSGWITANTYDFGLRPAGTYTWRVKARDASLSESTWSEARMLTVTIPDLAITRLTTSPGLAAIGQAITVSVEVTNVGSEAVPPGGFRLDLYVDDAPTACNDFGDYNASLTSLAAGASQTVTFNLPGFPAAGDHTLRAYADSACAVEEAGEANNQGSTSLGVRASLPAGIYDDTDARLFYSGSWTAWSSSDLYGGSAHYALSQGSAAEFIIDTGQFSLIYTKDDEYGDMDVYVDGVYLATIEQNFSAGTLFQQTWTSPDLGAGPHVIRLVQKTAVWVEVDAIRVRNVIAPPAPVTNLQAAYAYDPGRVILTWNLSPDENRIDGYRVFRNGATVDEVLPGTATFTDLTAACNTTYTYSVRAYILDGGEFTYSDAASVPITTGACPPGAFGKTAPANSATGVALAPTLTWAASTSASGYEYCVGTTSGNCNLIPWTSTGLNTQATLPANTLEGSKTYYWQVRATNAAGTTYANGGTWWAFTTLAPDLVVTGITTSPAFPLQGQSVTIEITIRNQGTGPTPRSGFMVDLYVDRQPSGCGAAGDYYVLTGELAAGASRVVTITTSTLPAGSHNLRANVDTDCTVPESNENNNLSLPQAVHIVPILAAGTHDDSAPIIYLGEWAIYTSTGPYNNAVHYSTATNSTATFAINGPRFRLIYTGFTNRGTAEIYVDGSLYATLNQYNSTLAWQRTWISGNLGAGVHTIRIVHATGAVVDIDAITVITDVTPPAAIDNFGAFTGSTTGSVNLLWNSPGDDGNTGTATYYLVRYATAPILTETDWNNAVPVTAGVPAPLPAGSPQSMTISGLTPGNLYYFSIRAVDDVDNIGSLSISPSASAKPLSPLAPGTYNDDDPNLLYTGNWTAYTASGPTNNTLRYSTTTNSEAAFSINGNRFTLTYTGFTNRGTAEIYVDGALYATLNQYNSSLAWQRTWTSGVLPGATPHAIRIVHKSGSIVDIDAVTVANVPPPGPLAPGAYNDDDTNIVYTGDWNIYNASGPTNNTLRYSTTTGSEAAFSINGNRFTLTYTGNTNRGTAEIYVDGALYYTLNQYNSSLAWQRTWTSGILTGATPHTVRIVHKSGSIVDIDAVTVANVSPPGPLAPGTYNDDDTNLLYTGDWNTYTGTGPTNNTLRYSTTTGSEAAFSINGNRFSLTYTGNTNRGTAEIYVDGVLYATLNQYNSTLAWQRTWTSGVLPGATPHTVRIVHKSGSIVDIDAITVANVPPPGPLAPGAYNDDDTNLLYTGDWNIYTGTGPTNNTLRYSTTTGSEAAFSINGNRFTLTYTGFTNRGTAEIYVDGVLYATLNQYNSSLAWQRTWTSGFLTGATPHAIRIVHKSGAVVDLDAITVANVTPPDPLAPGTYDNTDTNIVYTSGWTTYTGTGPTNNTLHYSLVAGSDVTFLINGNRFSLTYTGFTNRGTAEIYVDGALYATLNQYNSTLAWQRTWTSGILPGATPHTVRIVHKSGAVVDFDAVTVSQIPPLPLGVHDDSHSHIVYRGSWTTYSATGPTNDILHYSTTPGNEVNFDINGNRFVLTYTGFTNRGIMEIYVDGSLYATLDQYNATLAWQRTWISGILPGAAPHNIRLVHKSGAVVDLDGVTVLAGVDSTPPETITDLAAYTGSHGGSVDLFWTAPGDDGNSGTAARYLVRYAATPITSESAWNAATPVTSGLPAPYPAGLLQNMTISGLVPEMVYYFAVRTEDEEFNRAGLSNSPSAAASLPAPLGPGTYDQTESRIAYRGSWSTYTNSNLYGGSAARSSATGNDSSSSSMARNSAWFTRPVQIAVTWLFTSRAIIFSPSARSAPWLTSNPGPAPTWPPTAARPTSSGSSTSPGLTQNWTPSPSIHEKTRKFTQQVFQDVREKHFIPRFR
jgi:LasA protease